MVLLVVTVAACGGSAPEVPAGPDGAVDEVLVSGRDVWSGQCANCHGVDGGGGRGPGLNDGRVVEVYPDADDQIVVVAGGSGQMPAFGERLSDEEIRAVVRYTREVL